MPTNFPTSLDSFTNPTPANNLSDVTVLHTDEHSNANDAVTALEVKVGINGSANVNSLDYKVAHIVTPQTITNVLHKWLNSYNATTGLFTQTQPDYSDLTSLPQLAQTSAAVAHQFLNSYTASTGLFTAAQPDWSDLTNVPATFPIATPGTLTATTTNNASGAHTHAVTNSSNPGAAVSLLSSDASGQLQLVNQLLTGYGDYTAITTPASPIANHIRLYAETNATHGHTRPAYLDDDGLEIVIGRDSFIVVKNTSGGTINIGQAVYVTGSTGNVPNVSLAKADSLTTLPALGVAMSSIANNAFGYIMVIGILSGFDTSAFASGDQLYVSTTTAGALTKTRPTNPNYVAKIGEVLVSGVGTGSLLVDTAPFIGNRETGTSVTPWTAAGVVNAVTGYQVNGAATLANYLRGNGTNFVSAALAWGDLTGVPATFPIATPGTLTVSTTNNAAGAHTHAITSSSNPGATASILATAADGSLALSPALLGYGLSVSQTALFTSNSIIDSRAIYATEAVTVNTGVTASGLQIGVYGICSVSGAGTIGNGGAVYGGYFDGFASVGFSGTVDKLYGIYVNTGQLSGTINTAYSLYVDGPTGTITTKYGIYQATASISNYFASPTTFAGGISTGSTATTWNSGTAFPGSPATNDRFFRTDLGFLCYYDGTRWLTAHEYSYQAPYNTGSATGTINNTFARIRNDYATWFTRVAFNTQVATTNDGSNYWTFQVISYNTTFAANTVIFTADTHADTVNAWTNHDATPSTQNPANYGGLVVNVSAKTGTPGAFAVMANIYYRLIVT